jgi:hypothetical protein
MMVLAKKEGAHQNTVSEGLFTWELGIHKDREDRRKKERCEKIICLVVKLGREAGGGRARHNRTKKKCRCCWLVDDVVFLNRGQKRWVGESYYFRERSKTPFFRKYKI